MIERPRFGLVLILVAASAMSLVGCGPLGGDWKRFELFTVVASGAEAHLVGVDVDRREVDELADLDISMAGGNAATSSVAAAGDTVHIVVSTGADNRGKVFRIDRSAGKAIDVGDVSGVQFGAIVDGKIAAVETIEDSSRVTWYGLPADGAKIGEPVGSATVPLVATGVAPDASGLVLVGDGSGGSASATVSTEGKVTIRELPVQSVSGVTCRTECVVAGLKADRQGVLVGLDGTQLATVPGEPGPVAGEDGVVGLGTYRPDGQLAKTELLFRAIGSSAQRPTNSSVTVEGVTNMMSLFLKDGVAVLVGDAEVAFAEAADTQATVTPLPGANTTESFTFAGRSRR